MFMRIMRTNFFIYILVLCLIFGCSNSSQSEYNRSLINNERTIERTINNNDSDTDPQNITNTCIKMETHPLDTSGNLGSYAYMLVLIGAFVSKANNFSVESESLLSDSKNNKSPISETQCDN